METVDDFFRRNSDSGDKELGAAVDDNIRKLTELSLCIIITAGKTNVSR